MKMIRNILVAAMALGGAASVPTASAQVLVSAPVVPVIGMADYRCSRGYIFSRYRRGCIFYNAVARTGYVSAYDVAYGPAPVVTTHTTTAVVSPTTVVTSAPVLPYARPHTVWVH